MTVDSQRHDQRLILTVRSRLDAHTVEGVRAQWADEAIAHIIVDCSATPFIDSMGLAVLVAGLKQARARGGTFALVAPSEAVLTILELTAMDRVFTIVPDIATAEKALTP
jgi:anti-anti-sigma factor